MERDCWSWLRQRTQAVETIGLVVAMHRCEHHKADTATRAKLHAHVLGFVRWAGRVADGMLGRCMPCTSSQPKPHSELACTTSSSRCSTRRA